MKLTISQARKILGKAAEKLTEEELEQEILTAGFLAELILETYPKLGKEDKVKWMKV
jgi:hypothetical protein